MFLYGYFFNHVDYIMCLLWHVVRGRNEAWSKGKRAIREKSKRAGCSIYPQGTGSDFKFGFLLQVVNNIGIVVIKQRFLDLSS